MMLLTLIENALKHGLAPLPEGGLIRIAAQREDGSVRLASPTPAEGSSRAAAPAAASRTSGRACARYGANASLGLQMNAPRGVIASIVLPAP